MIEQNEKTFLLYIQSEQTAQQFLYHCYKNIEGSNAKEKSYRNCHTFLYNLQHGQHFFHSGKKLNTMIKPILYFYGIVHFLKAALLTKRPDYPETTKLLAHGVSARKIKRKNYTFLEDEVKIQHNGLFPYFSKHLYSIPIHSKDKYKMSSLLALLPEMNGFFQLYKKEKMIAVGTTTNNILSFPLSLLDTYHITKKAFLNRMAANLPTIKSQKTEEDFILVELAHPIQNTTEPFYLHLFNNQIYFPINRDSYLPLSEVMIHYLLLYNLSMLSRYETEWWGNLLGVKSTIDYPFIKHFLHYTSDKITFLINQYLYNTYLKVKH